MNKPKDNKLEFICLKALDTQADPSEVVQDVSSNPATDEPGDDAILVQEELYDGISSAQLPSSKIERE